MNGYSFEHCTMYDADSQPHMLVPHDMNNIPVFPGDIVYNESDTEQLRPFEVIGICTYDTKNGTYQLFIDSYGRRYFADEFYHAG